MADIGATYTVDLAASQTHGKGGGLKSEVQHPKPGRLQERKNHVVPVRLRRTRLLRQVSER
ncbi:hypothetical protein THIX_30630 [Thiomonas sp. X19]|nr:hypothetical protein THIX_30630 [Thiomonas sp. X19]